MTLGSRNVGADLSGEGRALGLGDRNHGVILKIRENQRGPGSWEQPSLVCLPWANCPEFNSQPLANQAHRGTRFSDRQLLAPAHKQHGAKGVAERLGGAGGSRDSRAFLPISGVVKGSSGLCVFGLEEA